jgi:hypothetical protein
MANNYIHLSSSLVLNDDKEKAWFEKYLPLINGINGEFNTLDGALLLNDLRDESFGAGVHVLDFCDAVQEAWEEEMPGPLCTVVSDPDNLDDPYVWVRDDGGEVCTLDNIVALIGIFLNVFGYEVWHMEWAETCSKQRLGEFGGGAVIVTKNGTRWLSTSEWVGAETDKLDI